MNTKHRELMRKIVDAAWQAATESSAVPSTEWADRIIDGVLLELPLLELALQELGVPSRPPVLTFTYHGKLQPTIQYETKPNGVTQVDIYETPIAVDLGEGVRTQIGPPLRKGPDAVRIPGCKCLLVRLAGVSHWDASICEVHGND